MNLWLHNNRKRGQSIVIVALSATALFGIIALGMDAGRLYFQRRDVQNAADAGALAGAQDLLPTTVNSSGPTTTMQATANCDAASYALTNMRLNPQDPSCSAGAYQPNSNGFIIEPSSDASAKVQVWTPSRGNVNEIHVRVFYNVPLTFAAILGFTSSTVVADAFAHGGFYNKVYTVFGFDAGGNGNSVNYDQNGNTQIDDGSNGTDICNPSPTNGRLVSNAKWHAPNPGGGWMNLNGQFYYAQAADTHALVMYWYANVSTAIATEPTPNYEPVPNPGGIQPGVDTILPSGSRSYPNGDTFVNNTGKTWYVYSPGQYSSTLNLTGNADYLFRNGIYYFTSGGINVSGGAVVANTSDGMTHYGPFGGITNLNPAADGTNGVAFVFDGNSSASFTTSGGTSPSVFLVGPTFVPAGTDSIVFFIASTNSATGPSGQPWVETIDGTKPTAGGYPFQIWGSLYNADDNGTHGTDVVLQAVSTSRYAVTGEVISPQVDLDGGNLANGAYTPSNPGTTPPTPPNPCNPGGYHQNTAGYLVQFNPHYVPHFRGLAFLVR
jgi:Flp pilus assembly protein TadG